LPWVLAAVLLSGPTFAQGAGAAAGDAKSHHAAAEAAAKAKDWAKAADEFRAANALEKSPESAEGLANAEHELGHVTLAYEAYEDYLNTYSAKLPAAKKALAEKRLKELAEKTGAFTIEVNEPGAEIFLDDKSLGKSPLPRPVRVLAGPHRIRVVKEGFLHWEQAPNASAQGQASVSVKLEVDARKARLNVREQGNQQVHVFVDGVDMGAAPWSGDVDGGEHEIVVKSATMLATPQKITVAKGETKEVVVVASTTTATLKVSTADGKGVIYIDGKVAGEGVFSGDIPAGPHKITVKRDGYDPFEEDISLKEKETVSRSVTLQLVATVTTGQVKTDEDRLEGLYGSVGLSGILLPTGNGNDIQNLCDKGTAGMTCSGSPDIGGALHGYVGYHWDPVGMELFLQAAYDQTTPTVQYASSPVNLNADPAREEKYAFRRIGGTAAARARLTWQTKKVRLGFAAGPGFSYRQVLFQRDAKAIVGTDEFSDKYAGSAGYWAPALSLDAHVGWRVARAFELQLGFQTLLESARAFNQKVVLDADNGRQLVKGGSSSPVPLPSGIAPSVPGQTIPITTPSYQLITGSQVFTGIYIGAQFGP
jgi:hypothetical protein